METLSKPIGYDNEDRPIWLMFGAEPDEADDTDAEDEEETEPETVESLKERLAKADAALKKANKEAERLRLKHKKPAATQPKKQTTAAAPTAPEDESEPSEVEQWKTRAIRSDAKAALLAEGFTGSAKAAARLIKAIDTDELEFDPDTNDVVGLDEAIEALREDFPNLFKGEEDNTDTKPKKRTRPVLKATDKGGNTPPEKKSARQLRAERLMGG